MTLDKSNTDKLAEFRNEAQRLGISVEPPLVNRSGVDFEVHADGQGQLAIRYALSAVKGVGEGQAAAIVAARGATPFAGLGDFARRINPREVNKKALESLAAAGAFDDMEPERARAFAAVEGDPRRGQSQPGGTGSAARRRCSAPADQPSFAAAKTAPWPAAERLRREFEAIGFFLSGHPLDAYAGVLARLRVARWADFARAVKQGASAGRLAATVLDRAERRTKSGAKMGIVTLSDPSGQYEAILFQEGLAQYRDLLEKGAAVLVTLQANVEGEDVRARIVAVEALDQAANRVQRGLRIFRARRSAARLDRRSALPGAARARSRWC